MNSFLLVLFAVSSTKISSILPVTRNEQDEMDWKHLGELKLINDDHQIEVTFAICQANKEWLEEKLWLVSDPFSKEYRNTFMERRNLLQLLRMH